MAAGDVEVILEAMEAESNEQGSSMAEIGRGMLVDLDRWNEVPRERWQDASTIKSFFKTREYRIDPRVVPGATRVKKCVSYDNRDGLEGQALRLAMATQSEADGAIEQSSAELLEDALPTRAGNGLSPEAVGAGAPEGRQACNTLIDGHVEQPHFPKRYSLRPSRGAQPVSVATYSDGIRWPRR